MYFKKCGNFSPANCLILNNLEPEQSNFIQINHFTNFGEPTDVVLIERATSTFKFWGNPTILWEERLFLDIWHFLFWGECIHGCARMNTVVLQNSMVVLFIKLLFFQSFFVFFPHFSAFEPAVKYFIKIHEFYQHIMIKICQNITKTDAQNITLVYHKFSLLVIYLKYQHCVNKLKNKTVKPNQIKSNRNKLI